ncbi:hypothetical protein VTO73DRAFT_605 [Trametes versicolor]
MILNPNFYHHDRDDFPQDSPPHLLPRPPFPHQTPVGFSYSGPQYPVFQQPFSTSYPSQGPSHSQQQQSFMLQHRSAPLHPRPFQPSLLNDPAFSPDPRSNPYFFTMNDREEIYPASLSDSLSDYASTAPDEESEIDHNNLPPRMRMLQSSDSKAQPLSQHLRSQSVPYPPIAPSDENLSRSYSTRVIPIPPPISRASASGGPFQQPSFQELSQEDLRQNAPGPSSVYTSAFIAPRDLWQPPPPYSESESGSSSSSSLPLHQTPASSSSHLPREAHKSTSSLALSQAYALEKSSPLRSHPPSPTAGPSKSQPRAQATSPNGYPADNKTEPIVLRPPAAQRNVSAPDLHPPPPQTELPPRPSTVPIAAPTNSSVTAPVAQRKRSKNASTSAIARDLDRIDELDESDPLGFAWHHDGPYEAIAKANSSHNQEQTASGQKRAEPPKRKPVQYGSVAVGVAPGQIFPSNSQYQPPTQRDVAQLAENMPPGSLPSSPLMQVPVQRRLPPSGVLPSSPAYHNNRHMSVMQAEQQQQQKSSRTPQPPSPIQAERSRRADQPEPSPPLPNPYSPGADGRFPDSVQDQRNSPPRNSPPRNNPPRNSPPRTRAPSVVPGRPELPSSSVVPHPDISLPPPQQAKSSASLLPRHLPKRLVMPAPLQPNQQQASQQAPDGRSAAHVEVLAQRHTSQPPPAAPSMQSQSGRAQEIPFGQGPKVLRKRHTTGGVPLPMPIQLPMAQGAEIPASNTTAALFAARVRFAEPPREETKEERKKREKEQAKREKEREKMEKARAKEQPGVFARDQVREAELAREREMARAQASAKASAGRKLSKRR